MKQEKQQAIALMRYGAIAPLIAGLDEDYPSKTAFYMMNCRNGSGILKRIIHACRRQPFTDSSKMMVSS